MNRYTVKDSHGEYHQIDADALNAESGLLSLSKKGSPGYIAQFRDWASYRVEPIADVVEPAQAPAEEVVSQQAEPERTKRPYNRKAV